MAPPPGRDRETPPAPGAGEPLEQLLRFGALMLRAGATAFRVRRSMTTVARDMGFDALSVHFGLGSIAASGQRGGEVTIRVREVGAPVINTGRIVALEQLARASTPAEAQPAFAAGLAAIESAPPRYSIGQTAASVGAACGAFAFLNGGAAPELAVAAAGGAVGQGLRLLLLRRRFNPHAVALVCALAAAGVYCLIAAVAVRAGFSAVRSSIGLISSALFLVPGFHLVAVPLDLLQNETGVALSRMAYAMTQLMAAALGLSAVITVVRVSVDTAAAPALAEWVMLALRALATFAGACGFAILYNSPWRNAIHVGVIAVIGNEIRLALHGAGLALPPATFLGALAVGLMASLLSRWLKEARVALTVPAVIMMMPGLYAFETVVYFKQGAILQGLQSAVLVGFVVTAMAMGLAAARFASEPAWLRE